MSYRVLLADDHRLMREGLKTLLAGESDLQVVGEAEDGRSAVNLTLELRPDVVIMDVAMPGMNGIEATRQILHDAPGTKVIALSMHSDRRFVSEMLKVGAVGYLLKDGAFEELVRAVRAVLAGQTYLHPRIASIVIEYHVRRPQHEGGSAWSVLTSREREVLQLLSEGKTSKQIAAKLHISAKTVESHRRQITEKLGLRSVAELTKYAIREGLTSLED
ncbi:MAG: response regulator transcription factor [Pseudomonadota bacterium]